METIVAISTASGQGSVGIIRISGKKSFEIVDKIFVMKNKIKKISDSKGFSIKYGEIIDEENIVDEVLVSVFKAPKSYTTEDVCEINSHGGTVVMQKILELCLKNGAVLASPGEFTKRAFLNGRIDLSQAESVIDIINAKTDMEAKASINQLNGKLSFQIKNIRELLLDVMSDIEAAIDYPEYETSDINNIKALEVLLRIKEELCLLEKSFNTGKIIKDGVKTVIIGKPNSGKSSLLNIMLDEERAIVSNIEGTTRDTIEEFIKIDNVPLKIIDTAGIRNTQDEIEKIGVEKAKKLINDSDLVIALFDITKKLDEEDKNILKLIKNKKNIILLNKSDLKEKNIETINYIEKEFKQVIEASMVSKKGIKELNNLIINLFNNESINISSDNVITNIRHKNHISLAIESTKKAISGLNIEMPLDIVAIEIKQILEELGNITGDNVSEDIINTIFSKFCLGK